MPISASVAVWVLYELAARPELLPDLRAEILECLQTNCDAVTYDNLQDAVKLDSFIREVMRTKGDTLSTCRMTTTNVGLGNHIIPKGEFTYWF